jgi:thioredoxin 1
MSAMPIWPSIAPLADSAAVATAAKAIPKIKVVDHGGTYNGSAFPAIVTLTGGNGPAAASLEGVAPTVSYCQGNSCSTTPPTKAGTYTVIANFPGSKDYGAAKSAPLIFTIAKATPTVHVTDVGGAYTGLPFPAAVTVTGVKGAAAAGFDGAIPTVIGPALSAQQRPLIATGLEGVIPTVTYCHGSSCSTTPPTQPGTYTAVAIFPGSADYAAAKSSLVTFKIIPGVVQVNQGNFQQQVIESQVPVLVDFSATWCEWCQKEAPVLAQLAQDRTDIKIVEIDVDANPALVQEFNVTAIPRLLLFKNGQKVADTLGYQTEPELLPMLG